MADTKDLDLKTKIPLVARSAAYHIFFPGSSRQMPTWHASGVPI